MPTIYACIKCTNDSWFCVCLYLFLCTQRLISLGKRLKIYANGGRPCVNHKVMSYLNLFIINIITLLIPRGIDCIWFTLLVELSSRNASYTKHRINKVQ